MKVRPQFLLPFVWIFSFVAVPGQVPEPIFNSHVRKGVGHDSDR
jgi:hypothetical protein